MANRKKLVLWLLGLAVLAAAVLVLVLAIKPRESSSFSGSGTYTAGKLVGQSGFLSMLPEDGSRHGYIMLDNYDLTLVNEAGETTFTAAGSSILELSRAALADKLKESVFVFESGEMPKFKGNALVYQYYSDEADYPTAAGEGTPAYSVYIFNGVPTWFAEGEMLRLYELVPYAPVEG